MNRHNWHLLAALPLVLALAGCGSTPSNNHYLLSAQPTSGSGSQSPSLGVGPIQIPEYLNRNGLVYNRDGNRLFIASHERWAEPLGDGIQRVMSLNLAGLLGTENVQSFPWRRGEQPDYGVEIQLMALDANDSEATLVAEWAVQRPDEKAVLVRRISQLTYDMPAGDVQPEQIPPAYSQLLLRLSELIADRIRADAETSAPGS